MADVEKVAAPVEDVKPTETEAQDTNTSNGDAKAEEVAEKDSKSDDRQEKQERNGRDNRDRRDRDDRGGRGRGSNRGRYQKFNKREYKASFENLPESDDPEEIRKQVEFYFSDVNLPQDRFLFEQTGGTTNNPVPIKTIHSFKRMKHFQPYSAVVAALKDSTILNVVNNDEDIQRKEPLADSYGTEYNPAQVRIYEDASMSRSIYAKGFGKEYDSIQTEIEEFFEPYGPVKQIRLRRIDNSGWFKGSVFVEFESDELAARFMELEPKPAFKEGEAALKVMSKKEYVETKADEVKEGKIRPNEGRMNRGGGGGDRSRGFRGRGGRGGRGGDRRGGNDRGDRDRDDWKGRRSDFQKGRRDDRRKDDDGGNGKEDGADGKKNNEVVEEAKAAEKTEKKVEAADEGNNGDGKKRAAEEQADAPDAKKAKADE